LIKELQPKALIETLRKDPIEDTDEKEDNPPLTL